MRQRDEIQTDSVLSSQSRDQHSHLEKPCVNTTTSNLNTELTNDTRRNTKNYNKYGKSLSKSYAFDQMTPTSMNRSPAKVYESEYYQQPQSYNHV